MAEVRELDTLGAWLLEKMSRRATSAGHRADVVGVADNYAGLIEEVRQVNRHNPAPVPALNPVVAKVNDIGRSAVGATEDVAVFLQMLGSLFLAICRRVAQAEIAAADISGLSALQGRLAGDPDHGADHLPDRRHHRAAGHSSISANSAPIPTSSTWSASWCCANLACLIVAIMVAGRSGSAYTAELGSMKMREEIDALSTMGLDPVEVLILPRIIALVCALPILSFIGSMAALYGGGLVAQFYGGMGPAIYIARLHDAVSVTSFEVGIIKAPFMALVIGIVACSEGLRVKGSAESLGKQTTTSVVKSIFLVIVLDGLFAVFFASIGM